MSDTTLQLLDEGSNGRIYALPQRGILKVVKRGVCGHDAITQMRIHRLCYDILSKQEKQSSFFVPALLSENGLDDSYAEYRMECVDTRNPVTLSDKAMAALLPEFIAFWKKMWYLGFALYDFELYQEPDGRIAILDFDKTCFRQTNSQIPELFTIPFRVSGSQKKNHFFFKHPCFPLTFLESLVGPEGDIEAQLRRVADLPYHM